MSTFLFSVDLEEFYSANPSQTFRRTSLEELTEIYLDFLRRHRMKATFFVVGQVAEKFRSTVRAIESEGHELACHTHSHVALDQQTPTSLREDLQKNLDALRACTSAPIEGFRAPILSLTEKSKWTYEVLAALGFRYSSSVLPSRNPLHGWPDFGNEPRRINGVLELPVTLAKVLLLEVPIGAGTYFRCLPFGLIARRFKSLAARGVPIVGYFHPYDVDAKQERVMHHGVRGSRVLNELLYVNRAKTIRRLEAILDAGFQIVTYREFLQSQAAAAFSTTARDE